MSTYLVFLIDMLLPLLDSVRTYHLFHHCQLLCYLGISTLLVTHFPHSNVYVSGIDINRMHMTPSIIDCFRINPTAVPSVIPFIFHRTISFVCSLPFIASSIFLLTYICIICSTCQVEFRTVIGMRNTYTQFNVLLSYLISKQGLWYTIVNARSGLSKSAGQPPK